MDKKAQEKYMELQMLDQQMKQIQKNISTFEQQVMEMDAVQEAIEELANVKNGSEILVPISSGIFAKAKIEDTNEFLLNVGSSVNVKKDRKGVVELIKEQQGELRKAVIEFTKQLEDCAKKAQTAEKELRALVK